MKIYFLRHAKTEPLSKNGSDFDRCLAEKGTAQALDLCVELLDLNPKKIACSSAVRTRETLLPFLEKAPKTKIIYLDELYLASLESWKTIFPKNAKDRTLFVGHNEGISEFISYLIDEDIELKTGTLVALESTLSDPNLWINGTAVLTAVYRPA